MSMLTGLYPREHGVFPPNRVLAAEVETLPEVFQRNGFCTGGFTEGGYVSGRFGFRRGFDEFVSRDRNHNRPVESTFRRGIGFLAGLGPRDRFFLKPRQVVVRQGGGMLAQATLLPDWTPVQVSPAGPGRLFLEADGCEEPEPADAGQEIGCQAFQMRGPRLARIELYDVSRDPGQVRDISRARGRTTRTLLGDLMAFQPRPVAAAAPLDPELEKSLRALGYLK